MKSPRNENALTPAAFSRKLFKLERSGKYEDALAEVRSVWPDTRYLPNLEGLKRAMRRKSYYVAEAFSVFSGT